MEKYLLLEGAIRKNLNNIGKKIHFSKTGSRNYRDKLVYLKNELKLHIVRTDELKNNKDIISRYKETKEKISLGLKKILEQELDETVGLVDPSEQDSDEELSEEENKEDEVKEEVNNMANP